MSTVEYWKVSNETNTDVHICTLRYLILVETLWLLQLGTDSEWTLHCYLYNCLNRHEKCWNCIDNHLTGDRSENYIQWRELDIEIWDVWIAISLFALQLAPLSVNWVLIDSEVSNKKLNVIAAIRISLPIDEKLNSFYFLSIGHLTDIATSTNYNSEFHFSFSSLLHLLLALMRSRKLGGGGVTK